jgi:hypothetical protein
MVTSFRPLIFSGVFSDALMGVSQTYVKRPAMPMTGR